jgi:activator of HSP90 ATPase
VHSPSPPKESVKELVRKSIVPQLRKSLHELRPALIAEHGKDIQHAPGSGPSSGVATPVNRTASSTVAQSFAKLRASTPTTNAISHVNTAKVTSSAEFRTTAAELFTTFTDPGRLAAFTRSPPSPFEGAKPGGKFGLFGGGVTGEYVSLKEPTQIVQKWRLTQWPQGHYTNLTLDFDQDDVDAVTNMRVTFDAVPLGEEDSTKEKWGEYYVRSLKMTFGFGTIL